MPITGAKNKTSAADPECGNEKFVRKIVDLPTIPRTLMRIWQILESSESSFGDLENVISLDQALTAKVIRLANSTFYNTTHRVSNVKSAIVNVGFDAIRNLVIAVSVTSIFKRRKDANRYFPLNEFWRHCVGVGVAARVLASGIDGLNAEDCFCGGILHDIGKFVLNFLFPKEFATALGIASADRISLREAEERVFSADHAQFGEALAKLWNFSDGLKIMIGGHHKSFDDLDERFFIETAVIRMADTVVRSIGYGFPGDFIVSEVDQCIIDLFDIDSDYIERYADEVRGEIEKAKEFMNLMT